MSSIRPLATITVLAMVGVFLYLKIDETEPPLPAGVDDWSSTDDIQFDMGMSGPDSIPEFSTSSPAEEAPAFSATMPSAPAEAPAFAQAGAAPKFEPAPVETAPVQPSAPVLNVTPSESAPAFNGGEETAADTLPDLPPLPALPPSPSTAPSFAGQEVPAMPDVETAPATSEAPAAIEQPELPSFSTAPSQDAPTTPTQAAQTGNVAPVQSSLFSATRLAAQAALDRGELSQALLLLSDWYGDPSLSSAETAEVNNLLSQLAGSVIYSREHRLEPPYMVQAGERLETIAKQYEVPWQLLAKINGITSADQLQPGQQLKVIRGPFSARVDLSERKLTLMLDRRYAGEFSIDVDPTVSVEEGHWEIKQKLLTPANAAFAGAGPSTPTEERSLMLANSTGASSQVAILRGAAAPNPMSEPAGRVIRLSPNDAGDVFDILSLGSKVVIRR